MSKFLMAQMVKDWLADNPEMSGLVLDDSPYYDEDIGTWIQWAHDENYDYSLTNEYGTIRINYEGRR